MGIVRLIALILFVNHYVACGWYAIGNLEVSWKTQSWVEVLHESGLHDGYMYTTAFLWSLAHFTNVPMDVTPTNWVERIYAISVAILGLVLFSSVVSAVTDTMGRLRQLQAEESIKLQAVKQYLHNNKVSVELGACIRS